MSSPLSSVVGVVLVVLPESESSIVEVVLVVVAESGPSVVQPMKNMKRILKKKNIHAFHKFHRCLI